MRLYALQFFSSHGIKLMFCSLQKLIIFKPNHIQENVMRLSIAFNTNPNSFDLINHLQYKISIQNFKKIGKTTPHIVSNSMQTKRSCKTTCLLTEIFVDVTIMITYHIRSNIIKIN